ncbi:hypothetical protein ACVWWO_004299 [Bradyrhizobium sp. F1.13.1]
MLTARMASTATKPRMIFARKRKVSSFDVVGFDLTGIPHPIPFAEKQAQPGSSPLPDA